MNQSSVDNALLKLVACGINHEPSGAFPVLSADEWRELFDSSEQQGVNGLAVDGFNVLRPQMPADAALEYRKLQWFGGVMQMEQQYVAYKKAVAGLGAFYGRHYIPMTVLKGYGLSMNYPMPEHRPTGDIDIYLQGRWQEADALMEKELGIKMDNTHHHHSCFGFSGFSVENHYDFINVHSHKSNKEIEDRFKALAKEIGKEILPNVYLPNPNLNALFVMRHAACDFAAGHTTLKQMIDWALLIKAIHKDLDWDALWKDCEMMGMTDFAVAFIEIAINYLGFDSDIFLLPDGLNFNPTIAEKVMADSLHPDYAGERPHGFLPYVNWMIHRWWDHRWKHKLVYTDSLLSTFVVQAYSHMLKPATLHN